MFDFLCILTAMFLYRRVWKSEESIAFWMLCFFVVSDLFYNRFALEFRANNNWAIYWIYNAINLTVMYKLKFYSAHLVALILIGLNVLLNIVVSFYFVSNLISHSVYNYYPYLAGFIMLSCLIYMWAIGHGAKRIDSYANNSSAFNFLFWRSGRLDCRSLF